MKTSYVKKTAVKIACACIVIFGIAFVIIGINKNLDAEFKSKQELNIMSASEYKILQEDVKDQAVTRHPKMKNLRIELMASEFIKRFANPFPKSKVSPTLAPDKDRIPRHNPLNVIEDKSMFLPLNDIRQELKLQKNRRMSLGDTDISQIPEVRETIKRTGPNRIPNIAHFIWFGCKQVKVHHYLSWSSVYRYQKPDVILFHTNCIPEGNYWNTLKKKIGSKLVIVKRSPALSVWGRAIMFPEHQADVARLHIMLEVGGIYLDNDMLVLKNLSDFMNESIVLGEENYDALANSIILVQPTSWFLYKWYFEYRLFDDSNWGYSSCYVPWALSKIFPSKIQVVQKKMLRPNWLEVKYIYRELYDWSENYAIHLYARFMGTIDGTDERTIKELAILNTTYGEVARFVLWGDKHAKDITEWI